MIEFFIKSLALAQRDRSNERLAETFAKEEQSGLVLVLYARFIVLAVLLVWAIGTARAEHAIVYAGILAAFAILGALPLLLRYFGVSNLWWMALFFTVDVILLTYILMVPGSMFPSTLTPQFNLQLPNFLYLCLFVVGMAISYSPLMVLWVGFAACIAWSVGMLWIVFLPDTLAFSFAQLLDPTQFTDEQRVETTSSRLFVSLTHWYNRVLFLALISLIIAASVWRSRRLLQRQISSESARTNLSRYFSPKMVDRLATGDSSLEKVNTSEIAVLFVDIVGFTELAEQLGAQKVIEMLRGFHKRMAGKVFDHGGTIDKYIGDALMANFGTPEVGPYDASDALRCAYAMIDEIKAWNKDLLTQNNEPVRIGIGVHFGEVVTGNIGDEHHLEYAVIGDTVNVANRLERLTRQLNSPLVVSAELVEQVIKENDQSNNLIARLIEDNTTRVRGRKQPIGTWKLTHDEDWLT
jgi:adenylate cyclase